MLCIQAEKKGKEALPSQMYTLKEGQIINKPTIHQMQ